MSSIYDMIVLGAGPAGLTAGLYGGRGRRSVLIIEKGQDGGQIATTSELENYPGQLLEGETGPSLVARMAEQAAKFGCERASDEIKAVDLAGEVKKLTGSKGEYLCKALIIATGAHPRLIGCKNEEEFRGRGVSYCATCDAAFFEGLQVYVVGGGDAAVEEALYLTKFARRVTIIHRRDELRAAKSIQEKAFANPNIDFMWDTVVESVGGEELLSRMTVKNTKTGEITAIEADAEDGIFGLFGFVGLLPDSDLFSGMINMENGYILTDEDMRTSLPGVFAAGDVRKKSLRQVITAAADGAIAAMQAEHYISNME
ncbi:MAG: thioredoxin-disulfide reductase [Christensenellales bacterium]